MLAGWLLKGAVANSNLAANFELTIIDTIINTSVMIKLIVANVNVAKINIQSSKVDKNYYRYEITYNHEFTSTTLMQKDWFIVKHNGTLRKQLEFNFKY